MAKDTKSSAQSSAKKVKLPEKFTASALVNYISEKNDISKKQAKEIIESLYEAIDAGAMSGQRVPVGHMGKLYIRIKPATKARVGRNPMTGEEIKIPAKKATKIPKFVFSKAFKESSLKAKVK
ncbi:MAG: HU family DNA-binding protein [Spirochaetes bacterium]|nr:HU family DNA-binding protein [Spirochaetota bacterium]